MNECYVGGSVCVCVRQRVCARYRLILLLSICADKTVPGIFTNSIFPPSVWLNLLNTLSFILNNNVRRAEINTKDKLSVYTAALPFCLISPGACIIMEALCGMKPDQKKNMGQMINSIHYLEHKAVHYTEQSVTHLQILHTEVKKERKKTNKFISLGLRLIMEEKNSPRSHS